MQEIKVKFEIGFVIPIMELLFSASLITGLSSPNTRTLIGSASDNDATASFEASASDFDKQEPLAKVDYETIDTLPEDMTSQ